jgi:hypothetical protein
VSAQAEVSASEWSRGTDIVGSAGVAANGSTGAVWGGALGWQLTSALAIEGNGGWFDYGHDTTAFSGALKARVRLFGPPTFAPYVHGGIGLYRTAFGPEATAIPEFYRRRLAAPPQVITPRTFTDPAVVAGGGLNLALGRHVALRPDATATMVFDDGRMHVVATVTLNVVYHFEHHPVTPSRR